MTSLTRIERQFCEIADALDAQRSTGLRTTPNHDGSRHCEFDGRTYTLTTSERGTLFDAESTTDASELLFWLVRDMTREMASEEELRNRPANFDGDSRIALFARHVELLNQIDEKWASRQRKDYDRVLAEHPPWCE